MFNRLTGLAALTLLLFASTGSSQRFINHGNGTITDTQSGLMWAQNADIAGVSMNLADTRSFVQSLSLHSDWRIPTRADFQTLFGSAGNDFHISLVLSGFTGSWWNYVYWTSDSLGYNPAFGAWQYYGCAFQTVSPYYFFPADLMGWHLLRVWPVRSIPVAFGDAFDAGGGRKYIEWFGWYNDQYSPWIWDYEFNDWLWVVDNGPTNVWMWSNNEQSWIWTRTDWYPWVWYAGDPGLTWRSN